MSWICKPLIPNQLAKAWHLNPSPALVPWVTDHQTFPLTYSTRVHPLAVSQNWVLQLCLQGSPQA